MDGVGLLGQGDQSVRKVLGMSDGEKAADFPGVTQNGTFKVAEVKGSDLESAVAQLHNTATALVNKVGNVEYTAEVVLRAGQKLQGDFKVVGNHLHRVRADGSLELQKANGKVITVRYEQP